MELVSITVHVIYMFIIHRAYADLMLAEDSFQEHTVYRDSDTYSVVGAAVEVLGMSSRVCILDQINHPRPCHPSHSHRSRW